MKVMTTAEMKALAYKSSNPYQTFEELWEKNQRAIIEQQTAPQVSIEVPKPMAAKVKPVETKQPNRLGDKEERTESRKTDRNDQALEVLKAMLEKPEGYTDAELVSKRIGGTDGPRRRRHLRQIFNIDFTKTIVGSITRWSLSDPDHAKRTLKAGKPVDKFGDGR
jgi:hypothetical protein